MNPKTCLVPIEGIYSPADASRQGELTMDSPCPSLPRPTPTPDPPLPPDPSPFPGPPLPEPPPTPNPPLPPDPSPFPGPPITIGQFTACSYLPLKGWSGSSPLLRASTEHGSSVFLLEGGLDWSPTARNFLTRHEHRRLFIARLSLQVLAIDLLRLLPISPSEAVRSSSTLVTGMGAD